MGFNNNSTSINLTAKLTAFGRQQLLANSSKIITHFAFSDSDSYYGAAQPLASGEVPAMGGNLGTNGNTSNSIAQGYAPKSLVYYNSLGQRKKLVKEGSSNVVNNTLLLGQKTISSLLITQDKIDRTDFETNSLVNLFYSFKLPITTADDTLFTVTPSAKGGYADTAMSSLAQDKILVFGIDSSEYGEMIDGKTVKLDLTVSGASGTTAHTIYSAYEKTLTNTKKQDANFKEKSFNSSIMGGNIAFLFSDNIQTPNADVSKSWATGHFKTKPYSKGNKSQFNMKADAITSTVQDEIVGVAYLDKGFLVITHPDIVNNYDPYATGSTATTATTIAFDSVSTQVSQTVTCIKDRGEFGASQNATWSEGDKVRVTEVLLLDDANNVIAIAKTDRALELTASQFMALSITISV